MHTVAPRVALSLTAGGRRWPNQEEEKSVGRQMSLEEAVELCEFVWPHTQEKETEEQEQGRASESKQGEDGEWQQTGVYGELLVYSTIKGKHKETLTQPNSEKVAFFDLDMTLICPRQEGEEGRGEEADGEEARKQKEEVRRPVWAKNENDWRWLYPEVPHYMQKREF